MIPLQHPTLVGRRWLGLVVAIGLISLADSAIARDASCRAIPLLPGSPKALAKSEATDAFCSVDFTSNNTAICAKTWSTSAAALVYDLAGTGWENRRAAFEQEVCPQGTHAIDKASRELAVFKHSMNFRDTSGTYAPAILLYDHLSRWLGTTVQVPAAAEYRFAPEWYGKRVVAPGLSLASQHPSRKMLLAAWQHLEDALQGGDAGREFLDPDTGQVWGAALLFTGRRYGPEINGTRESGWGKGQNYDFQHTAPFLALRHPGDLATATAAGIDEARTDPAMAEALAADTGTTQVAWWMLEVLDIVVLDYILGQQDRIGNIDYQWRWLWLEDNALRSATAHSETPPAPGAVRLRTTWLNDNDAGIRSGYANYARSTGMLGDLRHFNPVLYERLGVLAEDMVAKGPVYQAIAGNYHLSSREVAAIANRVGEVHQIITADCKAGNYRFDLLPAAILGQVEPPVDIACD